MEILVLVLSLVKHFPRIPQTGRTHLHYFGEGMIVFDLFQPHHLSSIFMSHVRAWQPCALFGKYLIWSTLLPLKAFKSIWVCFWDHCLVFIANQRTSLDNVEHELANDYGITISSLSASTSYQVDVCSVTSKGNGPRASIRVKTDSVGDTVPAPPTFTLVGRRTLHIKWQPPEVIAGRLTRYDLFCNDRCIYSGTDQEYRASMLKSDTDYAIEVVAITNEGRFRSRPAKTRTLKDECLYWSTSAISLKDPSFPHLVHNSHRQSLFESSTQHSPRVKRAETMQVNRVTPGALERHIPKEGKTIGSVSPHPANEFSVALLPSQNIQITSIRAVHFKVKVFRSSPISCSLSNRPSRHHLDEHYLAYRRVRHRAVLETIIIDHA